MLVGLVAATTLLSGCWTQVGFGPSHRNHNTVEQGLTVDNVTTLEQAWSVEIPGTPSEPMVSNGRVFVTRTGVQNSDVGVRALGVGNGATLWDRVLIGTTSADVFGAPVALADDHLSVGYAGVLDIGSVVRCGTEHGTISTTDGSGGLAEDGILVSPAVSTGTLVLQTTKPFASPEGFCGGGDLSLIVRDTASPAAEWRGIVPGTPAALAPISALPTVGDGRVYVTSGSSLSAFVLGGCNAPSCPPLWSVDLGPTLATASPVAGDGGTVVVATTTGDAIVLDGSTGAELWRTESAPGSSSARLALADGVLYVAESFDGSNGNFLRAFDAAGCGAPVCGPLWWADPPPASITTNPVVAGGVVYLGVGDRVVAYRATCPQLVGCPALKTVNVTGQSVALSVAQGRLFVSSVGRVTAFAPAASG